MIDPKEILAACINAQEYGQTSSGSMSQPFLDSIPGMSPASSGNAKNIMGNVQQTGMQMLNNMAAIQNSIDQQVMSHQANQQSQKSYDFNTDMRDLRPTESVGFPEEMSSDFFAKFRTS
jgi:hypothetical protein